MDPECHFGSGAAISVHCLAHTATAAARAVYALATAPSRLLIQPRMGRRLEEFDPREVRRIPVGHNEVRNEIQGNTLLVLRIWHVREDK